MSNMAGWSGFTDDDLRKMRQLSQSDDKKPTVNSSRKVATAIQQKKRVNPVKSSLSEINSESAKQKTADTIDPSMKLSSSQTGPKEVNSASKTSRTNSHPETAAVKDTKHPQDGHTKNPSNVMVENDQGNIKTDEESQSGYNQQTQPESIDIKELDECQAMSVELDNMQKFQQRQKVIEEANKHKRALLAKAIIDRQKKAKAEAVKLMKVQQELNHLDTLLTADVNIIRDKIEMASLEYMDAQKRYEKAEKEFITAKMDLFAKGEAKEQLTEHLYTIIHQNEVRKAKKLVELMEKLAMEVTPEEMELTIPAIPQLTNFTAVSTLHDPFHTKNTPTTDKDIVKSIGIETALSEEGKKPEANDSIPNNLAINADDSSNTMDTVGGRENIPEINNSHVEIESSIHILQPNEDIRSTDFNQIIEALPKSAIIDRSDNVKVSQNNCQSLIPNDDVENMNNTPPTGSITDASQTFKNGGDSTSTQGTIPLNTDKALSQSCIEVLDEKSAPGCKATVTPGTSSNVVSPGSGWTLPFS